MAERSSTSAGRSAGTRRLDRRRTRQHGAAVVDFVLIMLVLVPLVLGIMQVALVIHVRDTLTAAASEGARVGAEYGQSPSAGAARTRTMIGESLSNRFASRVSAHDDDVDGFPGVVVDVSARVPALGLFGPSVGLDVAGHAVREQLP